MNTSNPLSDVINGIAVKYDVSTRNLQKSFDMEVQHSDLNAYDEVMDGSLFKENPTYKKLDELEEGDVWVWSDSFDYLTVELGDSEFEESGEYVYYSRYTHRGLSMFNRTCLLITEVTENHIKADFLGYAHANSSLTIKKESDYRQYVNIGRECLMMNEGDTNHVELKALYELSNVYEQNRDMIERKVNKIYEIAKDIFGESRVDLQRSIDVDDSSLVNDLFNRDYMHILLIHFPELEITNSKQERHTIEDLYIGLTISIDGSAGIFRGIRATLEAKEVNARYGHSHLSCGHYHFSGFCLGRGNFSDNMAILKTEYDEELWEICLTQMIFYLEWESLVGGPFHKIEKAITGGKSDEKYMSDYTVRDVTRELNNLMPEEMKENVVDLTIQDSGDGSTQLTIEGLDKVAKWIEEFDQEDYADVAEHADFEDFKKGFVYVSSDNRRIGYMKLREARNIVERRLASDEYKRKWINRGFDFNGEHIVQKVYVDEALYDESYQTAIVNMNSKLESYLSSYIMMNFMDKTTKQVEQYEQENQKYEEYKEQQEQFPEEIFACTSVF